MTPILVGLAATASAGALLAAAFGSTLTHGVAFCVLFGAAAGLLAVLAGRRA